jgi:hypothetical protein
VNLRYPGPKGHHAKIFHAKAILWILSPRRPIDEAASSRTELIYHRNDSYQNHPANPQPATFNVLTRE